MQHPRIKMVRCAGTLPATFGHARRRMDVLAYSHGSGARHPGMAPHGSHVDAGWHLLPAAASSPLAAGLRKAACAGIRSEEHTSELQSLMRISYAVCCL